MSETIVMPPIGATESKPTPTVYFIDDSATMREVIKIAFRRESINVITCADAASALAQFEEHPPDVVITDVIMPDQDGYSVCSQIKQNPQFGKTPVILMSGVVNKSVADRAVAVQADELGTDRPRQEPFERHKVRGSGTPRAAVRPIGVRQPFRPASGAGASFAYFGYPIPNVADSDAWLARNKARRIRLAARPGGGLPAAKRTANGTNSRSNRTACAACHRAIRGNSQTPRGNRSSRTVDQKVANRTSDRAAIQSSLGTPGEGANAGGVATSSRPGLPQRNSFPRPG
jgi:CheY-like chemotaxis protein